MKTLNIFTPLLLFLRAILLFGVKDPRLLAGVGERCENIRPPFFFFLPLKYILAKKMDDCL